MENLRRYRVAPVFTYKGKIIQALLFYKGNTDLVDSWDVLHRSVNLSKAMPDERRALGFTEEDMERINEIIAGTIDREEGRL